MKNHRPRLKDIAQQLGVSTATISRALRNRPDISDSLKEKVRNLAHDLHYQPNAFARQFQQQRNFCLGVVIPRIVHQYLSTIISGIIEEASSHHYQVMVCESGHSYEKEVKLVDSLASGTVDGLLICVSNYTRDYAHLERLKQNGIPFVLFDKDVTRFDAPKVIVDDYKGAMRAVEHLIEQGYRHIAHLQDNHINHSSQKRMKGYFSALRKHGLPIRSEYVRYLPTISVESGRQAMEDLLRAYPNLDATFAITDELAIGAMQAAQQLNRRIPQDFGVIGFSDWQISSLVQPRLSTVAQPGLEVGHLATRMLISQIEHPERNPIANKILRTQLLVRESSTREPVTNV